MKYLFVLIALLVSVMVIGRPITSVPEPLIAVEDCKYKLTTQMLPQCMTDDWEVTGRLTRTKLIYDMDKCAKLAEVTHCKVETQTNPAYAEWLAKRVTHENNSTH